MQSAAHGVQHYENFPVASWLTPARLRLAIVAIYWFARVADDLADEGDANFETRMADLAAYRADLEACYAGQATSLRWSKIFQPLQVAIEKFQLPQHLLLDLLDAFEQDVRYTANAQWYQNESELLSYCQRSANPIGRLLLHLYDVNGEKALDMSDSICSALQLINFWQDPSRDIPRNRFYFPVDAMFALGVPQELIKALSDTPETMKLIAACAHSAGAIIQKGFELPALVRKEVGGFEGWRLSFELRCVIQGGLRILDKLKALQFKSLAQRPKINAWDALIIVFRALRM